MKKLACWIGVLAFAVQSLLAAETPVPTPSPKAGPQAVLAEFYHWYVESLNQRHDPLSDERAKIGLYVSQKLLQQIDKISNSPDGMDEDYFTKSQDILEDWPTRIAVTEVHMKDSSASAVVTLGATKDSIHRLRLNLVREGTSWKISKVR